MIKSKLWILYQKVCEIQQFLLVGGTKIGVLTEENEIKEPIDEFEKLPWIGLIILKVWR